MMLTGTYRVAARAGTEAYARAALAREAAEVASTASGRNVRLNAAGYALGQLVGAGLLGEDEVMRALMEAAEACGHTKKRGAAASLATVRSGLRAGLAQPRDVPAPHHRGGAPAVARPLDPAEVARRAHEREVARLAQQAEDRIKADRVRRIWDRAVDPRGTLAETYFNAHRRLDLLASVCGHALRFLADGPWGRERVPMLIAAMRCARTGEITAVHRTRLDPDTAAKVDRRMLGNARGAAIMLTPYEDVSHGLHIAEGIETAISGMMIGFSPMWALGSSGNIKSFDVLPGVEALTICGETGDASADAVEECGVRWSTAGREVRVSFPRSGSDLNDAIQRVA